MNADNEPEKRLAREQVDLAVEVFRMLADATRVEILWALVRRECAVNELAEHLGRAPASISQHLAKLRMARLVATRRDGTKVFYRVENQHVAQLVIDAIFNAEHAGPEIPSHHRDDAAVLRPREVAAEQRSDERPR